MIYVNIFCIFFSLWVALTPRFRTGEPVRDWFIFAINMFAVVVNMIAVGLRVFS